MKLHSMVEIALLRQFFSFSAGTAASRRPLPRPEGRCSRWGAAVVAWGRCRGLGPLPGERAPALPSFLASVAIALQQPEIFKVKIGAFLLILANFACYDYKLCF